MIVRIWASLHPAGASAWQETITGFVLHLSRSYVAPILGRLGNTASAVPDATQACDWLRPSLLRCGCDKQIVGHQTDRFIWVERLAAIVRCTRKACGGGMANRTYSLLQFPGINAVFRSTRTFVRPSSGFNMPADVLQYECANGAGT